jgi:hypothetical protein
VIEVDGTLIVLDEKLGFRGMLLVSDILRVVASDERPRADVLESFIFPPRRKKPILGIDSVGATFIQGEVSKCLKREIRLLPLGQVFS